MSVLNRHKPCQIYDVLYVLITRSLGGKSVKCVVDENECVFTSDVETLLSSLSTEHPETELVIQSLKNHKAQYGEGLKCFLFMVTRIAKAVRQLEQLGIAHSIATSVMLEAINHLKNKVFEISIPVTMSHPGTTAVQDLSLKHRLIETTIPNYEKEEHSVSSYVLFHNKNNSLSCTNERHFPDELMQLVCEISPEGCGEYQNTNVDVTEVDLKSNSRSLACTQGGDLKQNGSFSNEISTTDVMESDIVYLKMSSVSKMEDDYDNDDLDWLLDNRTDTVLDPQHLGKDLEDQVMKVLMGNNSLRSGFCASFPGNSQVQNNKNGETALTSLGDSDFEDCFDDKSKYVTIDREPVSNDLNDTCVKYNDHNAHMEEKCRPQKINPPPKMRNELKDPTVLSCSFGESKESIDDEFADCFDEESVEQIEENQVIVDSQSDQAKTFLQGSENVKLKSTTPSHDYLSHNEKSASSEVARLNSLLKQIGHHKTHSNHQVLKSTRYDFKEGISGKNENKVLPQSSHGNRSVSKASFLSNSNPREMNPVKNPSNDKESEVIKVNSKELLVTGKPKSDTSELTQINGLLKHLSAKSFSIPMTQILTSSRHMHENQKYDHREKKDNLLQQETTNQQTHSDNQSDISEVVGLLHKAEGCQVEHDSSLAKFCGGDQKNLSTEAGSFENLFKDFHHLGSDGYLKPVMRVPEDVCHLSRGWYELMGLVKQVYCLQTQDQIRDNRKSRFDLNKYHCVSNQSSNCLKKVVKGLVIASSTQAMKIIDTERNSILVNGDMTPSFVHKGCKPVVSKKLVVETSTDSHSQGKEQNWAAKVLKGIKKLNIDVLLVKGRISNILLDMLSGENTTVLTNVPFRVLEIVSHCHRVKLVSYVQDAEEADVCKLCFEALDDLWMDRQGDSHCLIISNIPYTQTVVLQLPSVMSCQMEEEKVWKCFYRLSNALKDGFVLPGYGMTEAWCERQLRQMAEESSVASDVQSSLCLQKTIVMQSLADVFQDFVSIVRMNVKTTNGENLNQKQQQQPFPSRKCETSLDSHNTQSNKSNLNSQNYCLQNLNGVKSVECDRLILNPYSSEEIKDSGLRDSDICMGNNDLITDTCPQSDECPHNCHYDTYSSKVSAWSSAVDLVQVMFSLGSLVVTGASSSDLSPGEILL